MSDVARVFQSLGVRIFRIEKQRVKLLPSDILHSGSQPLGLVFSRHQAQHFQVHHLGCPWFQIWLVHDARDFAYAVLLYQRAVFLDKVICPFVFKEAKSHGAVVEW